MSARKKTAKKRVSSQANKTSAKKTSAKKASAKKTTKKKTSSNAAAKKAPAKKTGTTKAPVNGKKSLKTAFKLKQLPKIKARQDWRRKRFDNGAFQGMTRKDAIFRAFVIAWQADEDFSYADACEVCRSINRPELPRSLWGKYKSRWGKALVGNTEAQADCPVASRQWAFDLIKGKGK